MTPEIQGLLDKAKQKGFTLVELAVSLVVIGLLIGLGTAMVGPLMNSIKVRESRENLGAAVESINGWAAGNNRLPQWGDGAADATTDEFVEVARNSADAWGRPFIYLFDSNLFNAAPTKDTICGRRSTALTLNTIDPAATITNVAYIVLSQGDDAVTDSTIAATPVTSGSITSATTVTANTSDDLVRWVTLDELRTKVGCQGPQLRIVNNELPYGYATSPYASTVTADGGVPYSSGGKYRWCIEGVAPAGNTLLFRSTANTAMPFNADCKTNLQESSWVQSDALVISLATFAGNTDSTNIYACALSHTAATDNRPTSGTNWSQYWKLIGTTLSVTQTATWTSGTSYAPPPSTNSFKIYVRDNGDTTVASLPNLDNDNFISKTFVLTINP